MRLLAVSALFLCGFSVASATAAGMRYIRVHPTAVARGGRVTVSGRGCRAGETVYLISPPFVGNAFVEHSVATRARANRTFSRIVRIRRHVHVGRYLITARCGGGNLGVSARLRVH
jgi:hypothetical protein